MNFWKGHCLCNRESMFTLLLSWSPRKEKKIELRRIQVVGTFTAQFALKSVFFPILTEEESDCVVRQDRAESERESRAVPSTGPKERMRVSRDELSNAHIIECRIESEKLNS